MDEPLAPEDLRRLRITSAGMVAGTLIFLGVAAFLHQTTRPHGPHVLSSLAMAWALMTPGVAILTERALAKRTEGDIKAAVRRHLVAFGILESGGLACAIALIVASDLRPLAVAVVPIVGMVLRFLRAS
jgi:hypothetical protein